AAMVAEHAVVSLPRGLFRVPAVRIVYDNAARRLLPLAALHRMQSRKRQTPEDEGRRGTAQEEGDGAAAPAGRSAAVGHQPAAIRAAVTHRRAKRPAVG